MAKYVIHYEMRQGARSVVSAKNVECEDERTAIQIAEAQGKKDRPGFDFNLRRVEKK